MKPRMWPCALVVCWACGSHEPPRLEAEGDPCNSRYTHCIDDDTALSCEDRVWTPLSCDELCARMGPSYVADGCDEDCVCVLADPNGCTPGETSCVDDSTLATCNDQQQTETTSCDTVCMAQGLASSGCVPEVELAPTIIDPAECWCTQAGTPCDAAAPPSCVDASTLSSCIDGVWTFESCADICGSADASCDPWMQPVGCAC